MSVSCYFGLTESGKSWHVKHHVLPKWDRKVIFDIAHCFDGDVVLTNPGDRTFLEIFRRFIGRSAFTIVIRPSRTSSDEALFNKTVHLACSLGRTLGVRVDPAKRIQLVLDEADFVCSSHYQSKELKHLVNKGRHDNVDSHFITRNPNSIHTDIRRNASKIVTFFLNNAMEISIFRSNFSSKFAEKIQHLPKYHRLEWTDNGDIRIFDEKNKVYGNFSRNSPEISPKKRGVSRVD